MPSKHGPRREGASRAEKANYSKVITKHASCLLVFHTKKLEQMELHIQQFFILTRLIETIFIFNLCITNIFHFSINLANEGALHHIFLICMTESYQYLMCVYLLLSIRQLRPGLGSRLIF